MKQATMKRLSSSELDQLRRFLDESPGAMPLGQAQGFLAAVASTPEMVMPSTWLPMVIGEPDLTFTDAASDAASLVLRQYNQILDDLNAHRPVSPDEEEDLSLWCRGYLAGTALDEHWRQACSHCHYQPMMRHAGLEPATSCASDRCSSR